MYKVFLVEDEIVTREGIRDNVNWGDAGFEFCGEAGDGEIALQLIQEIQPDVLITDIKMPFMDGLQLSKLVRKYMPWMKIIILSGHDEFDYAQSAVKLGVTEYLLKPITSDDLHQVLLRLSKILNQEQQERERLKTMNRQVKDSLKLNRENFLLNLVMGAVPAAEAIEQGQQLGLDIVARYYLVAVLKLEFCDGSQPFDHQKYKAVLQIVSEFAGDNLDVFLTKKDFEELLLIVKGDQKDQLVAESKFLVDLIISEIKQQTACEIEGKIGSLQDRIGHLQFSFLDAVLALRGEVSGDGKSREIGDLGSVALDHEKIDYFLKCGSMQEFDEFFSREISAMGSASLQSELLKKYLFVDLVLASNQYLNRIVEDKGNALHPAKLTRELDQITSLDQIKKEVSKIFEKVLEAREKYGNLERNQIFHQVMSYLDNHFQDPDLRMGAVADAANLSPSYFSSLFHQEIGETFREYLVKKRINYAKRLLRTTNFKIADIAQRSGYKDAHYFSQAFKKDVGKTPSQFRLEAQTHSGKEQTGWK